MKTVAICHQKGGVSKSTICQGISLEMPGTVAVYDSDPQGSSAKWLERREAGKPVRATGPIHKLPALVKACEKQNCDWLIIDTPPWHDDKENIRSIISVADFVILPTKMSRYDIEILPKTVKIANSLKKPWMIVLTMGQRSNLLEQTKQNLSETADLLGGSFCSTVLMNRVAHSVASYHNSTASEMEAGGLAAFEIRKIAEEVRAALR